MKTTLPKRSALIQRKLDNIVQEILAVAKDKIAMIILFGSYARGDWVQDEYQEGHITYSYQSDLDLMILLKKGKYAGPASLGIEHKIEQRLKIRSLRNLSPYQPWITLVLEPISVMNAQLEKGHYFFSDIKREGIILYDSSEFELSEIRILPWEERREIAKEDYEYWFGRGKGFFMSCNFLIEQEQLCLAAFNLHQVTESFYNAILLVFSGYKPKLHDIRKLGGIAGNYNAKLWQVFNQSTPEQKECFELLEKAYIEARYNKHYKISKEQLIYLIGRVEKLQEITEQICLEKISGDV